MLPQKLVNCFLGVVCILKNGAVRTIDTILDCQAWRRATGCANERGGLLSSIRAFSPDPFRDSRIHPGLQTSGQQLGDDPGAGDFVVGQRGLAALVRVAEGVVIKARHKKPSGMEVVHLSPRIPSGPTWSGK